MNNLQLNFNGYDFNISDTSDASDKKFLIISCSGGVDLCDIKYSRSTGAKHAIHLEKAARIEIYAKSRLYFERNVELQLQYSIESSIDNFDSFFNGSLTEDYNSPNTFRAADFDEKVQNARRVVLKIYRNEFNYKWLEFEVQNAISDSKNWFSKEYLTLNHAFNLFSNTSMHYMDSTGGMLSVVTINNSAANSCDQEFFWFKIICEDTMKTNCSFDWNHIDSKCAILHYTGGTSWTNRPNYNHHLFKMIEIYTEPMTVVFSYSFSNPKGDFDILSFYKNGHVSYYYDLDSNIAFRHYKMEKSFTTCNNVKFRIYTDVDGSNVEHLDQEFIFRCDQDYMVWFTVSNLIKASSIDNLLDRNLVVEMFDNTSPYIGFTIRDRTFLPEDSNTVCHYGILFAQTNIDPSGNHVYNYCKLQYNVIYQNMTSASRIEILVDSNGDSYETDVKKWQLVFMVEAFSGIHIYHYYKNGSTEPAVPGQSKMTNGDHFFRHPKLESRILEASHIRFSVYNLKKRYVVNEIIFQKRKGTGGIEDWFHGDHVRETSSWDFSNWHISNPGNIFTVVNHQLLYKTQQER